MEEVVLRRGRHFTVGYSRVLGMSVGLRKQLPAMEAEVLFTRKNRVERHRLSLPNEGGLVRFILF